MKTKTYLLIYFLLSMSMVNAQAVWEVYEDSTIYSTSIRQMRTDNYGNVYTMGLQPEELYPTLYFIDKKDSLGNTLWKVDVPETIVNIHTSKAGTTFALIFTDGPEPVYDKTYKLRAYDTNGDILWEKAANISGYEHQDADVQSIILDYQENVILAMHAYNFPPPYDMITGDTLRIAKYNGINGDIMKKGFFDPNDWDGTPLVFMNGDTKGNIYLFIDEYAGPNAIRKFNKNLVQQYAADMGGYVPEKMNIDGNKYIFCADRKDAGTSWDSVEIRKFDALNGNFIYKKSVPALEWLGTSSTINIYDSEVDSKGNYVVLYYHSDGVQPTAILKIKGTSGDLLFNQNVESAITDHNLLPFLFINSNDEILISGRLGGFVFPVCYKYSKLGNQLSEFYEINDGTLMIYTAAFTSNGYMISGNTYESLFYTARYTLAFGVDSFEKTYSHQDLKETTDVILYPNPVSEQFQIISDNEILRIRTYSLSGTLIPVMFNQELIANVNSLPAGLYITEVYTNKGREVVKWVKE